MRFGKARLEFDTLNRFLSWVLERDQLEIRDVLPQISQHPFFLIAGTGLGKTVGIPLHLLLRTFQSAGTAANPAPVVWVVEPRISIVKEQMAFMNGLWAVFLDQSELQGAPPLFGSISSATGRVNPDAPIRFITTGLLWLLAQGKQLQPGRDRVVVDEAHVTLEQGPDIELAVAALRRADIKVDFMSATVATEGLQESLGGFDLIVADPQRFPVWKHNLQAPVEEALADLIQNTLITPDYATAYYPQTGEYPDAAAVREAVADPARSHGMLFVINSFAGDHSDARRIRNALRRTQPDLPVLLLAGEVVRDARRLAVFSDELLQVERRGQNYVVIATSVVEMGITFPTLDYVVTLDSGYEGEVYEDDPITVVRPLGVNALMQRLGRVGRRRPGIAYITKEVGASYSSLTDQELNTVALERQPIRFPVAAGAVGLVAYLGCEDGATDVQEWLASLGLPSRPDKDPSLCAAVEQRMDAIRHLGLASEEGLTDLGERVKQWLGRLHLPIAIELEKAVADRHLARLLFWLVVGTLGNRPAVTLRARNDFFVDYEVAHPDISHVVQVWDGWSDETLACVAVVAMAASLFPSTMFPSSKQRGLDTETREVQRWAALAGVDSRTLLNLGISVEQLWSKCCKNHAQELSDLGLEPGISPPSLRQMTWRSLMTNLDVPSLSQVLIGLPGLTKVIVQAGDVAFDWSEYEGERRGTVRQDDTPVRLVGGRSYSARLQPAGDIRLDEGTWRLTQLSGPLDSLGPSDAPAGHSEEASSVPPVKGPGPSIPRGTIGVDDIARELGVPHTVLLARLRAAGYTVNIASKVDRQVVLRLLAPSKPPAQPEAARRSEPEEKPRRPGQTTWSPAHSSRDSPGVLKRFVNVIRGRPPSG